MAADASGSLAPVRHHLPDLRFSLTADDGRAVTQDTYRGKPVLLFFGFTGCSAACPVVLPKLADVARRLGGRAAELRILFVTLDPQRDTPEMLRGYLHGFAPASMVGLTGDPAAIAALAKRYRVAFLPSSGPLAGDLPHGDAVYVFDRQGQARWLAAAEDDPVWIATAVEGLLP